MAKSAAESTVFVEPMARRSSVVWDPDLIRAAEIQADGGDLTLAADLCDFIRTDAKVQGDLKVRAGTLLGLPLTFEPGMGRARRANRVIKALEAEEDWWKAFPEGDVRDVLAWGSVFSFALCQNAWQLDPKSGRMIPRLRVWNPRWLRRTEGTWKLRVADGTFGTREIDITPNDGTWWFYAPDGGNDKPWMNGAWRSISRWVLLKRYALGDWGNYSGRKGSGVMLVTGGTDQHKDHRRKICDDLSNIGRDASVGVPDGWDVELIESTANTSQTFEKQTNNADRQIGYALLGHNQTSEEGGSFAKAQSLNGVRVQVLQSDAEGLSTSVHDGALEFWAAFNFGTKDVAPWPAWDASEPEDTKADADAMLAALDAAAKARALGIPVDREALAKKYKIPVVEGAEFLEPAPLPDPNAPQNSGDDEEEDEPPPKKKFFSAAQRAAIASAVSAVERAATEGVSVQGARDGQRYADALGTDVRNRVQKEFRADVAALRIVIDGAKDFKDLRKRIVDFYEGLDPATIAKLTEKALILSRLGGQFSVLEDL